MCSLMFRDSKMSKCALVKERSSFTTLTAWGVQNCEFQQIRRAPHANEHSRQTRGDRIKAVSSCVTVARAHSGLVLPSLVPTFYKRERRNLLSQPPGACGRHMLVNVCLKVGESIRQNAVEI